MFQIFDDVLQILTITLMISFDKKINQECFYCSLLIRSTSLEKNSFAENVEHHPSIFSIFKLCNCLFNNYHCSSLLQCGPFSGQWIEISDAVERVLSVRCDDEDHTHLRTNILELS